MTLLVTSLVAAACAAAQPAADPQAWIEAAIRDHQPVVRLPAGIVRLQRNLTIRGAAGLTIEGPGTTLVLRDHATTGLSIAGSRGVVLRGFTIDYDPLPFTQATVTATAPDRSWVDFQIHDGYPALTRDYCELHIHAFEPDRQLWKRTCPDYYPRRIDIVDDRHGRLVFNPATPGLDQLVPGDRLVLNKRTATTIRFNDCADVRVEDLTVLSGPGCGVMGRYMDGDNRFRFTIQPGPPPPGATQPRLMSTCADGFNYAFARRGPTVEGCRFSFLGDDSVNLHGATLAVLQAVSPTELRVGWPYSPESLAKMIRPGDEARWLAAGSFAVRGRARVASFAAEREQDPAIFGGILAAWPRNEPKDRGTIWRVTLDAPLPAAAGDWLDVPAANAAGYRIANCEFTDHRARGLRLMASDGVVEDNTFRRLKMAAITIGAEYAFWREAGWAENVVVRRNLIADCGQAPGTCTRGSYTLGAIATFGRAEPTRPPVAPVRGNRNLRIEDNVIRGCAVAGVHLTAVEGAVVRGNRLSRVLYGPVSEAGTDHGVDLREAVDVRHATGVEVADNVVTEVGVSP